MGIFSGSSDKHEEAEYGGDSDLPKYQEIFQGDDQVTPMLQNQGRSLDMKFSYTGKTLSDLLLTDLSTQQPAYYVKTHTMRSPDVELRTQSESGQVVGQAHIRTMDIELSLGGGGNMTTLESDGGFFDHTKSYHMVVPSSTSPTGKLDLMFIRTHSSQDGVKGVLSKMAWNHYKIVDQGRQNQVIGLWLMSQGITRRGTLHLQLESGGGQSILRQQDVEWILLAMSSLSEHLRRKSSTSLTGGGGTHHHHGIH